VPPTYERELLETIWRGIAPDDGSR